jgi:hypothetical protein
VQAFFKIGHILLQESVAIYKACCTQQTNSQELPEKPSPVVPESIVALESDAAKNHTIKYTDPCKSYVPQP